MPERRQQQRVVVLDWNIVQTSPAGSVVREELAGLADEWNFVVLANRFDNPRAERVRFVRVPLPPGPSFLKDTIYPYAAAVVFRLWKRRNGAPDFVQATQGQFAAPDIAYAHFCHQTYLRKHWRESRPRGSRRITGRLVHEHNARRERQAFERARVVVAPSAGLRRDLIESYPSIADKIVVIPNPVAVAHFRRPETYDVTRARRRLGLGVDDVVFVLVALGNFTRKGLHIALDALAQINDERAKLLVVGGSKGELADFDERARRLGVGSNVVLAGFVADVRECLWSSNVFVLPTLYEGFPLAALQAAAAGLPLVVTRVNGLDEILRHGETGWEVDRSPDSVAAAFRNALEQPAGALAVLGEAAKQAVEQFDTPNFVARWQGCYRALSEAR